ncbi:protein EMBRYO DEFECTIVE 514 [Citrus sinensis]|uniref:Protein EMBRYO DEFECTIVE 514 n=1 Tax=Citrus sinensis TaxID=2711 RepID=A0ACB8LWD3_CITSI|nr:protein EMBRYO DEFECTIVE 514 [Citrus sinensis]
MAEEAAKELTESNAAAEDMDLEGGENGGDANAKRARDDDDGGEGNGDVSKKQKIDEKSVEEERLEKKEVVNGSGRVKLGPKEFGSSIEMFDYFYKFLHFWPPNLNVNKYEHMVLLDLLKKGHPEPDKKIGGGIQAFQVRYHPTYKSRCFFLIREDETADDFSFRKCVDHMLPLPEDMKVKSDANKALGGGGGGGKGRGGGRGGHGHGHGKGGHGRGRGGAHCPV